MGSLRASRVLLASLLLLPWARSQTCPPAPTSLGDPEDEDVLVDDTAPFGANGGPFFYFHPSALRVDAEDLDGNGAKDLVVGGNSAPAVARHYGRFSGSDWLECEFVSFPPGDVFTPRWSFRLLRLRDRRHESGRLSGCGHR